MANAGKVIGKGVTIELEGNVYRVDDFQHVKPGKGAAFIRTRLKNIKTGGVVEKTFRPTEDVETAHVDRSEKQYLYNDGDLYYFMDTETYDQIALSTDAIGDALKFVKENDTATGATKPATVETGATVYVPLFVNEGDVIKIDTRTGEYLSRV